MVAKPTRAGLVAPKTTTKTNAGKIVSNSPFGPPNPYVIEARAKSQFLLKIKASEGYRLDVYKDTLGILTVGIGHKVTSADNLKLGDKITAAQANLFFVADTEKAFLAALSQARELGQFNENMIVALAEVNYQLGTGWRSKFYNTWKYLKAGNFTQAIKNLRGSAWASQTPVRVQNFIAALNRIEVA